MLSQATVGPTIAVGVYAYTFPKIFVSSYISHYAFKIFCHRILCPESVSVQFSSYADHNMKYLFCSYFLFAFPKSLVPLGYADWVNKIRCI
jgi:hypothetical protein